ncbi:MAG: hypothetical protein NWF12_05130 [Candidatus Bathyarchaeota archaeon]|nr:hypothetical protein [Candidatus Bathyarchaeota archaeon]
MPPLDEEYLHLLNLPLDPVGFLLGHLHQLDVLGTLLDPSTTPLLEPTPTLLWHLIAPRHSAYDDFQPFAS